MRRSLIALAIAALVGSALAFAPAVTVQQAETDHEIEFTKDGSATVEGAPTTAGTNLGVLATGCSKDLDTYCETVHVTVVQPVDDEDPGAIELGSGEVAFTLAPTIPGADFDIRVFESDEAGTARGEPVADSGNFPACAQVCEPLNANGVIDFGGCGSEHDECGGWSVSTSDLVGGDTAHYVIEVVYYFAGGGYTLDVSYERTDGRNFDGTTPEPEEPGPPPPPPAASADRIDVTSGFEEVGDWNGGQQAELGDALGQDIEAAFIEYGDDTFTFTIDVTNLPAAGGVPEFTRYGWSFLYNDSEFELDGKFTNYTRGACDPTAGNCPPPRNPGIGYFALRGNCVTNEGNVTTCEELGGAHATFDPADGTIAIPIPAEQLAPDGVAACDRIDGGSSFLGQSVWAAPTVFFTSSGFPNDQAGHYEPLVVPPADPALSC